MIKKYKKNSRAHEIFLAINSGTSMDGVDACLFSFSGKLVKLLYHSHFSYPHLLVKNLRKSIHQKMTCLDFAKLNQKVTESFINAGEKLLKESGYLDKKKRQTIKAVACHGQTLIHHPELFISIQLGNSNLIAEKLNINVISDFRGADLAAGGQGAPLAPIFHQFLFQKEIKQLKPDQSIAIVNLGGIGNITLLRNNQPVIGYDFAPANTFLDLSVQKYFNQPFDYQGKIAKKGMVDQRLLSALKEDDFFNQSPPKSTGIEFFSQKWLNQKIAISQFNAKKNPNNLIKTLSQFLAELLVREVDKKCQKIYLSGGGVKNIHLIELIGRQLTIEKKKAKLCSIDEKLPAQTVECALFAYLAKRYLENKKSNLAKITGSKRAKILGVFYPC